MPIWQTGRNWNLYTYINNVITIPGRVARRETKKFFTLCFRLENRNSRTATSLTFMRRPILGIIREVIFDGADWEMNGEKGVTQDRPTVYDYSPEASGQERSSNNTLGFISAVSSYVRLSNRKMYTPLFRSRTLLPDWVNSHGRWSNFYRPVLRILLLFSQGIDGWSTQLSVVIVVVYL